MEQRKEIRLAVRQLQATVQTRSGVIESVTISDFSDRGGLLLLRDTHGTELQFGDELALRVTPDSAQPNDYYDGRVLVRHRRGQRLGVKFLQAPRVLLEILRREVLVTVPNVQSPVLKKLVPLMQQQMEHYFSSALNGFADLVHDRIQAAQNTVRSDAEVMVQMDALAQFQQCRTAIVSRFLEYMQQVMKQAFAGGVVDADVQQAQIRNLSLIEKEEFERWLVIKVLVTKVETAHRKTLLSLQLRLDEMMWASAGKQINPFAPTVICDAMKFAVTCFSGLPVIERLLYRAFDEQVLAPVGAFYSDINQCLIQSGILPDVNLARNWNAVARKDPPPSAAVSAPTTKPEPATPVKPVVKAQQQQPAQPVQQDRYSGELLNRLSTDIMHQQQIAKTAYATALQLTEWVESSGKRNLSTMAVPLTAVEKTPLLEALNSVRQSADDQVLTDLQKLLAQRGLGLSRHDLATCQMVDGLVRSMSCLGSLNEMVEPWFSQLRVPLLQLALNNEQVFQIDQHPARMVLNRLARLGMKGQVLTEVQKEEIHSLISNIQQAETVDDAVFADCLPILDRMVHRQEALIERNLQRVAQVAESEQRRDQARQTVDDELERLLLDQEVPQALMTLLNSGWHDLLIMTCVRDGSQGDAWNRYWSVVYDLLARGKDPEHKLDLRDLLSRVKQGLFASGALSLKDTELQILQELKLFLNTDERGGSIARVRVPPVQRKQQESMDSVTVDEDPVLQRCMRRCQQLQAGDWIEMERNGQMERLRLAWVGGDHGRFVFVNHQGMKMCDFSLLDLVNLLRDEHARILEAPPQSPVDDALERMVQSMYDQLTWASTHDELTGLFNRREFEKVLEKVIKRSHRTRVRHILIHLDIDHLALVNAQAGYAAGDRFLAEVVKMMEMVEHGKRTLARLGGDEFGIILEECTRERAQHIINNLMQRISDLRFAVDDKVFQLTSCLGAVEVSHLSDSGDILLRHAESACRLAKESMGGNQMQWFMLEDKEQIQRQEVMAWVSRINQALEENQLELRCQKIAPLSVAGEHEGLHYEILLSMNDGEGGLISPSDFMQAAERYGRMQAVDRWVVSSVLRWMTEHPLIMTTLGGFSINLSGHSMNDGSLMEFIFQQFALYNVPREKLCFEVTETTAIANLADAADFIREMKSIGCRFALDDFGAGMSSYAYLKHLPVDFIKIDGSFIKNLHTDKHDLAMVRSIHEMARQLGKLTIAEYVENEQIYDKLKEIGVDFVQGYLIEKPILLKNLAVEATGLGGFSAQELL